MKKYGKWALVGFEKKNPWREPLIKWYTHLLMIRFCFFFVLFKLWSLHSYNTIYTHHHLTDSHLVVDTTGNSPKCLEAEQQVSHPSQQWTETKRSLGAQSTDQTPIAEPTEETIEVVQYSNKLGTFRFKDEAENEEEIWLSVFSENT